MWMLSDSDLTSVQKLSRNATYLAAFYALGLLSNMKSCFIVLFY